MTKKLDRTLAWSPIVTGIATAICFTLALYFAWAQQQTPMLTFAIFGTFGIFHLWNKCVETESRYRWDTAFLSDRQAYVEQILTEALGDIARQFESDPAKLLNAALKQLYSATKYHPKTDALIIGEFTSHPATTAEIAEGILDEFDRQLFRSGKAGDLNSDFFQARERILELRGLCKRN